MICFLPSVEWSECQTGTSPCVAVPPKQPDISTSATFAPASAAFSAAKTPVQLPPTTTTSKSPAVAKPLHFSSAHGAEDGNPHTPPATVPSTKFRLLIIILFS